MREYARAGAAEQCGKPNFPIGNGLSIGHTSLERSLDLWDKPEVRRARETMHIFWSKLKYSPPGIIEREVAGVTVVHSRPISRTLPLNSRSQLSLIDSYTSSSRLQTGGNVTLLGTWPP